MIFKNESFKEIFQVDLAAYEPAQWDKALDHTLKHKVVGRHDEISLFSKVRMQLDLCKKGASADTEYFMRL